MELIDTLATIRVSQLPPNESFNIRVRLESRYGMCFKPSANLLMQFPNAKSDLLMLAPSLNRNLNPLLLAALSLPAKSIIESFTIRLLPVLESVIRTCTWKTAINKFCLKENQSTFETETRKFHLFPSHTSTYPSAILLTAEYPQSVENFNRKIKLVKYIFMITPRHQAQQRCITIVWNGIIEVNSRAIWKDVTKVPSVGQGKGRDYGDVTAKHFLTSIAIAKVFGSRILTDDKLCFSWFGANHS
uniref:Uncharacterized protein n=1 Tax=Glossina austeni TaxID=7395 RepID=A0A1A9UWD1_GLOAU